MIILMQLEFLVLWLWLLWLITGNVTVNADNNTDPAFKNCAPFSTCKTVIDDVFFDKADKYLHCNAKVKIDRLQQ